ncbi:hypothetical protein EW145_g2363 [Phellinidium pouzarii]|uniref:FAD-binding domain-containing protein n=1 Tax=Phellinidium pouzarii TaxID=167371 RepID=A0A4V3XDA6_9AGAM|nr:hypothetical protein EW145_g2363 [Phellinidium pouzarii]
MSISASQGLRIEFVIVGAGIAGLACAYSLRVAGHDVRVLEAQEEVNLGKGPAGIRIPPNMSRILSRWDLGPEFIKTLGGVCREVLFHSGYTGEFIGEILFHKEVMKVMEAEFFLMHHGDLILALYNLAVDAGVRFDFGAKVKSVNLSDPCAILSTGEEIFGDVIIGADGDRSMVRQTLQSGVNEDKDSTYSVSTFSLSASQFNDDEELMELTKYSLWNIWMGTGWAVFVFPVRKGSELSVMFYKEEREPTESKGWEHTVSAEKLNFGEFDFEPKIKRLMSLASEVVQSRCIEQSPIENWFDKEGHVVVVGQAAHYINTAGNHVAAMGMEDAVILGGLFSRLKSRNQIKALLSAYQELRESRYEAVQASEADKLDVVTLPPGPKRDARDATMRKEREVGILELAKSPDEYLRTSLEEFRVFGYDAFDEVDTWWVEWGVLLERMHGTHENNRVNGFGDQVIVESHSNVQ